jgi:hypothetical protein
MLRRSIAIISSLLLIVGCAGNPATQPTAAPGTSPTVLSTPVPATGTKEVVSIPTASNPVGSRGAIVPWIEYDAENELTNGEVLPPIGLWDNRLESSGLAVQLIRLEYVHLNQRRLIGRRDCDPGFRRWEGLGRQLVCMNIFRQKIHLTSRICVVIWR